jgi:outer membrane protein assembly factor BamB
MRGLLSRITILILSSIGAMDAAYAQADWPTYRHDGLRMGLQPGTGALTNIDLISGLHCTWSFPPDGKCGSAHAAPPAAPFRASPIVVKGTVFVGDQSGVFYALDAATGTLKWQYPTTGKLAGLCRFGSYGIGSSATYANIDGQDAVIFGAPDPNPDTDAGRGSARLFALDFSGKPIWKYDGVHAGSDVVAHVAGCVLNKAPNFNGYELHERIAYSSPLVLGDKVYVGVHDAGDTPIQQGRVSVINLSTGKLVPFSYASSGKLGDGTRGGGVWNSLATDGTGIFFTTGNTRDPPYCNYPYTPHSSICPDNPVPQPSPNYGLGMVRVDKDSGNIAWPKPFQPVDFNHDGDPDWNAGATIMSTSCGELVASVMKDGWSYGVNAEDGSLRWQFPNTGLGSGFLNNYAHGQDGYRQPGAAWNDVFIVMTGGWALDNTNDTLTRGYGVLHALNACATEPNDYVRWIAELTSYNSAGPNALGAPTVIGGFVYVGTDTGHLLVLADPSVGGYTQGQVCSDIEYADGTQCLEAGYRPVPNVVPIVDFQAPDGGNLAFLRKEPVLSVDQVFVTTSNGHIYALATAPLRVQLATDHMVPNGGSSYGVVHISKPAPTGGGVVALSSFPPGLKIPRRVNIPEGGTSSEFAVTDVHYSGPTESVTVTASYNGASATVSMLLLGDTETCTPCGSPERCCICAGGVWDGRFCE